MLLFRKLSYNKYIHSSRQMIYYFKKLIISIFSIHHDPNYYVEPLRFDPERFSMNKNLNDPMALTYRLVTNLDFA